MKRALAALFFLALPSCGDTTVIFPPDGSSWAPPPIPSWAHKPRFALTDNRDDTLAFVSTDLPTPQLYGFLPIGDIPVELEGPHHIAASPDGATLYVPLSNYVPGSGSGPHGSHGTGTVPGSLLKLHADSGAKIAEAVVDKNPGDAILSSDGKTVYVSHYDLITYLNQVQKGLPAEDGYSTIAVVDAASMARPTLYPVCATGHGMVLSPDEKTLYVACTQSDQIAALDLATHQVTRMFVGPNPGQPTPNYAPYALARSPADGAIWVSCNGASGGAGWSGLRAFDPQSGKMDDARVLAFNGIAMFGAFLSDGKTLIAPHQGDDRVSIVDTSQTPPVELASIALPPSACKNVHVAYIAPGDQTAYVVCEGDHASSPGSPGSVVAIDLASRALLGFAQVGYFPDGIVALPPAP